MARFQSEIAKYELQFTINVLFYMMSIVNVHTVKPLSFTRKVCLRGE